MKLFIKTIRVILLNITDMFKYIRYMTVKSLFFIPTRLLYTIIELRFLKEKNLLKSSVKISDVFRWNEKKLDMMFGINL